MFLINSRLGLFSAAASRSYSLIITVSRHPFSQSYGVILPSSLTKVLSRALDFSSHLPVSVCGTGTCDLSRSFSRQLGIGQFVTNFTPHHLSAFCRPDLPDRPPTGLDPLDQRRAALILLCHSIPQTIAGSTGILTSCPSPTLHASA